jgi:PPM family protein phosphatase
VTLVARHAALTDIGLHRSTNEDAYVAEPPLFAVADGMGGAQAGEVASHLALEALGEALAADAALPDAALAANARVYDVSRSDRAHSGMGTTLTAARLGGDRLEFVHVGDSRLYLWRAESLEQVTADHSLVGEMVREGHLTREAALNHPQRSILSRALGTEPRVEIDSGEVELRAGDAVVLCSDGLYSMVSETTIAAVLAAVDDPGRVARRLVHEAKSEGGHDNITVIVLRFDEVGGEAADAADAEATAATAALPSEAAEAATAALPAVGSEAAGDEQLTLDEQASAEAGETGERGAAGEGRENAEGRDAGEAAEGREDAEAGAGALSTAVTGAPPPAEAGASQEEPPIAKAGAPGVEAGEAPVSAGAATARRPRRRRLWVVVAVIALLAVVLLAGVIAADNVYFVGDYDGMVSVYHGLPWDVGGLKLYGLYLETTTPLTGVAPGVAARIDRHDLHSKSAALALARQAQGLP